jgi:glycine cleavage system H lipoate-binding protein
VDVDGIVATMSVTGYAAQLLQGIRSITWADPGETLSRGDVLAVVDAVKAACEIASPLSGEVLDADLTTVRLVMSDPSELDELLTEVQYAMLID